jgi:hypothetical protein
MGGTDAPVAVCGDRDDVVGVKREVNDILAS